MKVAYLCVNDPLTPTSFSGVPYFMTRALGRLGLSMDWIGRHLVAEESGGSVLQRMRRRAERLRGEPRPELVTRVLERDLRRSRGEVLFAPMAARLLARIRPELPVVYFSDATPRLMQAYYPEAEWATGDGFREAEEQERVALARSDRLIYTSEWAARSAVDDYGANSDRIRVLPFGANVDPAPGLEGSDVRRPAGELRLLFIASQFERKGGSVALETARRLNGEGVPTRLILVGDTKGLDAIPPYVQVEGWLNKSEAAERRRLADLMRTSHFLILPSRAETFGAVCCEANAYGLPVLASRTGGLAEAVLDGVNGLSFPSEATGEDYAQRTRALWAEPARYTELSESARREFEQRLSWDVIARSMKEVFAEVSIV